MPSKSLDELDDLVGSSKVTVEDMAIEAGKVEEFANAVQNSNPIYRDEAAAREEGYERIPAPPTFLMTKQFPRYRPDGVGEGMPFDLGFAMERVLHGEQAFEFERPVYVGDVLTGVSTLADVYQRDGGEGGTMTFAIVETEYTDQDDESVATDTMTIIERGGGSDE